MTSPIFDGVSLNGWHAVPRLFPSPLLTDGKEIPYEEIEARTTQDPQRMSPVELVVAVTRQDESGDGIDPSGN